MQYSKLCGLVVRTADSYTCGHWFDSYLTYIFFQVFVCLYLELYVRVNKFSVMSGRFPLFIGWTSSKQWITCVIVTALEVSLELALAFRSPLVGPLVQSSMCLAANSETPFWTKFVLEIVSMVILPPTPLSQLEQRNSGHSILIKYGTV